MGEGGRPGRGGEAVLGDEPDRRDPHDAAAALAVVERLHGGAAAAFVQRREAGGAGRTPVVEHVLVDEPAASRSFGTHRGVLRAQPPEVGAADGGDVVGAVAACARRLGAQQTLGGEQRHLGVVGDRADEAVGGQVPGDAGIAEARPDVGQAVELDRCAQRITDRATEEASEHTFTSGRHRHQSSRSEEREVPDCDVDALSCPGSGSGRRPIRLRLMA